MFMCLNRFSSAKENIVKRNIGELYCANVDGADH